MSPPKLLLGLAVLCLSGCALDDFADLPRFHFYQNTQPRVPDQPRSFDDQPVPKIPETRKPTLFAKEEPADKEEPAEPPPPKNLPEAPEPAALPKPEVPTATKSSVAGRVVSPFQPGKEIDVSGLPSGSLARDPFSGKIFRVP
jgi:hypothetical protein